MKILMLAPEPYFQPRGTPISVFFRLKALSGLGHRVDLVTYPLGEDRLFPNQKILRIPNLFLIKKVKIGPSWLKVPLDFILFLKAVWQMVKERYDLVFSHEEAALIGVALARAWRIPHLYDMHSSLPQQLENFRFSRSRLLKRAFLWMERFVLKNSEAVLVICLDLLRKAEREGWGKKAVLLENFLDFDRPECTGEEINRKRRELGLAGKKIVLYTGNFQPYQGIPLLLEAAARIKREDVVFLLVGGKEAVLGRMKEKAREYRVSEKVVFTGEVAPSQVQLYLALAEVLVSPRISGTNTPLKLYSFLKSGKPVVATDLWTHTQTLTEEISVLVPPDSEGLARGILFALEDDEAKKRARKARERAEREYTLPRYLGKLQQALDLAQGKAALD